MTKQMTWADWLPTGETKAKAAKVKLECQECGKKFSRSSEALDIECPKCHGTDWEVSE